MKRVRMVRLAAIRIVIILAKVGHYQFCGSKDQANILS